MKHQPTAFRLNGYPLLKLLPLYLALFMSACSKKGDPGPKGADGNPDVTVFNFGGQKFTSALNLTINVTQGRMDSSLILVYYNPANESSTAWYPVPGTGSGGSYQTRFFTYQSSPADQPSQYTVGLRLMTPAGAAYMTEVEFRKVRIFIVPAGRVLPGGRQAAPVDYGDYHAVLRFYGIGE